VAAAGPGRPVRLSVADTGQGIAAGLLPHVFDRFRSGDASAGSSPDGGASGPGGGPPRGTGLGLALVSAVARAHGGDTAVRSHPGLGSEFELLLPVVADWVVADWHESRDRYRRDERDSD
jgi:two-component system OmpR family sensor kinase